MFLGIRTDEINILLGKLYGVSSNGIGFAKVELRPMFIELMFTELRPMVINFCVIIIAFRLCSSDKFVCLITVVLMCYWLGI